MKKYWPAIFALTIFACNNANDKAASKAEIMRLLEIQETTYDNQSEENKKKAIATGTDSLIFIGGDDGGILFTPKAWVGDFADGYTRKPYNRHFQFYDNTAIVTSLQQGFKLLGGDTLYLNSRTTKVFVKENGAWKMAYVTYATLPVLYNKTVKPNQSVLPSYSGIYDLGSGIRDSVFVKDEKLYSGDSELLAINDSTFIGRDYFGKAIFARDHYTFEFNDGQRIRFNKISSGK